MNEQQPYLTVRKVAELLNIPISGVQRLIREKKLPAHLIGRTYRIAPQDLEKYLERTRTIEDDNDVVLVAC